MSPEPVKIGEVILQGTNQCFVERQIPCATVNGLLLLKLFALPSLYRQADFDRVRTYEKDVADLIANYEPEMEPLFDELAKQMVASDLAEIRAIVAEITERIDRAKRRFDNGD